MKKNTYINLALFILLILVTASFANAARVSIRAYFTSAFTDINYQRKMVKKVISHWQKPEKLPQIGKKTVIILRLNREGHISYEKLHMSSGLKLFDKAVSKCLNRSAPFDPLPKSYPYPYMEVHYHFEIIK